MGSFEIHPNTIIVILGRTLDWQGEPGGCRRRRDGGCGWGGGTGVVKRPLKKHSDSEFNVHRAAEEDAIQKLFSKITNDARQSYPCGLFQNRFKTISKTLQFKNEARHR